MDELIARTAEYVKRTLEGDCSGHDWWHIYRVWNLSKRIVQDEKVDMLVVELAALLHDIADWKFTGGDDSVGPAKAAEWLRQQGADDKLIAEVSSIIKGISFKGAGVKAEPLSIEGRIVQDADRLDALGAIGIARAFAYGGFKSHMMHDPLAKPHLHQSFEEYKAKHSTTINHFYEKLLLLKDRMNTAAGKKMAEERHEFMELYLKHFFAEWNDEP